MLKILDLQDLFLKDIHIANWGRRFVVKEFMKIEELLITRQYRPAIDRYKDLIHNQSNLAQRLS